MSISDINHPVFRFYQWPTVSEDFHKNTGGWTWSHCYHLSPEPEMQSLFPPKVAQFLPRISKNTMLKQTWISLTPFADSMRQTPTERQNAPVRKKLERTVAMLSWGFHAGSFCCLNALLSGHLEGRAPPSCERKFVVFFIFFLVRGRNNILMLDSL